MALRKINKLLSSNAQYKRYKKPLEAAAICDVARTCIKSRAEIISFNRGLLTVGVNSPFEAADLQMKSAEIIKDINAKIGQNKLERIRFKII